MLDLSTNQIGDIEPLVNNPGIGDGDIVHFYQNTLDCSDIETLSQIETLEARGVDTDHDC